MRLSIGMCAAFFLMQASALAAPVNDMFAKRVQISPADLAASGNAEMIQGSLVDATIELGEPSFSVESPGQFSVWYAYKAEKTGVHLFALIPEEDAYRSFLQLELFSGTSIRGLKRLGKAGGSMQQLPFVPYNLVAGRTYVLRVSTALSYAGPDSYFALAIRNTGPKGGVALLPDHSLERTVVDDVIEAGIGYVGARFLAINTSQKPVNIAMSNVYLGPYGRYFGSEYGKTATLPAATLGSNATAGWALLDSSEISAPAVATTAMPVTVRAGASRLTARYHIVSRTTNPTTTLAASFPKITNPVRIPYGTSRNVGLEVRNTGFRDAVGCRLVGFRRTAAPLDYGRYSAELKWKVGANAASPTFDVPAGGKRSLAVTLRPLWPGILYPAAQIIVNCANTGAGAYRPATTNAIEIDAR